MDLSDDQIGELNRIFESAPAADVIRWAVERFHPLLSLACSMTDAVLVDLAVSLEPDIEVVFIDTRYHFTQTLETMERMRQRYALNLRIVTATSPSADTWQTDPDACCTERKVRELDRALQGRAAWVSGARRAEASTRAEMPIVGRDRRGLVKINPIASWSDQDVARYIAAHDVPQNPLVEQGYPSIGCRPCTSPVVIGTHPRSGRWDGRKTECGLQL